VQGYVDHYDNVRLKNATGYITPKDILAGRQHEIHAERDRKLEAARKQRQIRRQQAAWRTKIWPPLHGRSAGDGDPVRSRLAVGVRRLKFRLTDYPLSTLPDYLTGPRVSSRTVAEQGKERSASWEEWHPDSAIPANPNGSWA
jgi:hypothetical protein